MFAKGEIESCCSYTRGYSAKSVRGRRGSLSVPLLKERFICICVLWPAVLANVSVEKPN
jgi:hypothetical protein